ncbi:MAG TPA: energy transducer TonB [Terracidiphilus sp.]|nr:energy transducer TonB [Terracidiphilus sp.]
MLSRVSRRRHRNAPGAWFLRAGALAVMLAMALPAWAATRAIKSRVAPVYPEIAKRMRIEGEVRVAATVDPKGNVTDVKEVTGNHILSLAAQDAVRKWKFEPGAGTDVVEVGINFALGQ